MTRSLAMKLRVLRAERQLSLREASTVTGVDKVSLSRFERGLTHPQDRTLAKIAEGYGVPVEELLEDSPKVETPTSATSREFEDRRMTEPGTLGELTELPPGTGTAYERLKVEDPEAFRQMAIREAERLRVFLEGVDLSPEERKVANESLASIKELLGVA